MNRAIIESHKDNALPHFKYPTIFRRICGFLLDASLIYSFVVLTLLLFKKPLKLILHSDVLLVVWCITVAYLIIAYLKFEGRTLGSAILNIKVVSVDGTKINFKKAVFRACMLALIFAPLLLFISASFIFFSLLTLMDKNYKPKKQTFWDAGTKTCVVTKYRHL